MKKSFEKQFISCGGSCSRLKTIQCGVQQGKAKQSLYIKETCFHHATASFVAVLLLWELFNIHLYTDMAKSKSIFDIQKMTFVSQPKLMHGYWK